MGRPDGGIGEAFARVAESLGRLVVQHLALLRTELEAEANAAVHRAKTGANAVARALPFVVAGLVLVSGGLAFALGLALEAWLGRAAQPLAFVLLGGVETGVAVTWLVRSLREPPVTKAAGVAAAPGALAAGAPADTTADVEKDSKWTAGSGGGDETSALQARRGQTYGSVGRA